MRETQVNLTVSLVGAFLAFEVGALVVCFGLAMLEETAAGLWSGPIFWTVGQVVIVPIAFIGAPFAAMLRWALGYITPPTRLIALCAGALTGLGFSGALAIGLSGTALDNLTLACLGTIAGVLAGWAWWGFEGFMLKPLDKAPD